MTDSDISNMLCNFADLQLCYTCPEEVNKTKAWQLLDIAYFNPNWCNPYFPPDTGLQGMGYSGLDNKHH